MNSLVTLIKLQKTLVDEQRVHLTKHQEHLEQVNQRIAALEIEKAREQLAAENHAEARATYGAFLSQTVFRARELEKERQAVLAAIEIARARLSELFEEQKRYEIADAARVAADDQEEKRRDRLNLDEIGSVAFTRKQSD